MNSKSIIGIQYVAPLALALCWPGLAAEAPRSDAPKWNYQLKIQIAPKDGEAFEFKIVTAGSKVRRQFAVRGPMINEAEVPSTIDLTATIEVVGDNKVWLRDFFLGQTIPYVTGSYPAPGMAAAEPKPALVARTPEGVVRPPKEGGRPSPGTLAQPEAVKPAPTMMAPRFYNQYQQMQVGTTTSLLLTLDKPVLLSEDNREKVTVTVTRLPE